MTATGQFFMSLDTRATRVKPLTRCAQNTGTVTHASISAKKDRQIRQQRPRKPTARLGLAYVPTAITAVWQFKLT
jgi:hypothetical protein